MTEPSQYFKGRTVQEQMNEVIGYVDTRAAEVATDAIASDVAQVHQDMLDADADAAAAAASAAAAAGTLANAVKKTGEASQSIAGDIAVAGTLSGGVVTGTTVTVPTPVNNTDAATKKYVDDADALKLNINDVNSYAVGLTGNQGPITGNKLFTSDITIQKQSSGIFGLILKATTGDVTAGTYQIGFPKVSWIDKNNISMARFETFIGSNGRTGLTLTVRNSDGTEKNITLLEGDN